MATSVGRRFRLHTSVQSNDIDANPHRYLDYPFHYRPVPRTVSGNIYVASGRTASMHCNASQYCYLVFLSVRIYGPAFVSNRTGTHIAVGLICAFPDSEIPFLLREADAICYKPAVLLRKLPRKRWRYTQRGPAATPH